MPLKLLSSFAALFSTLMAQLKLYLARFLFLILKTGYLVSSLAIPWFNSEVLVYLRNINMDKVFMDISIFASYFIVIVLMWFVYKVSPHSESVKKKIFKEFFSYHTISKSAVIYLLSIILISGNTQSFGIALLIPYYMFVINFYASISSGEIKPGWF
jgi:hypothetical protein